MSERFTGTFPVNVRRSSAHHAVMRTEALQAVPSIDPDTADLFYVGLIYSLIKTASLYGPGHPQLQAGAVRILAQLDLVFAALRSQTLTLVFRDERVYLNRVPVGFSLADATRMVSLTERMREVDVIAINVSRGVSADELVDLASRYSSPKARKGAVGPLQTAHISVAERTAAPEFEELVQNLQGLARYPLLDLYANGLAWATDFAQPRRSASRSDVVAAKRLVGQLIDGLKADPSALVGLVQLRPFPGSPQNRRIDTTVLMLGMALQIGLSEWTALELGVSSLLRPVSRARAPWWARRPMAPLHAAQIAVSAPTALAGVVAFESCAPLGATLPEEYYNGPTYKHVVSQMLAVAEAYVDLLQPGEAAAPCSADLAMLAMVAQAGQNFDAELVRELVNLVGFYPPGTGVRLTSNELAVVVAAAPPGTDPRRPTVRPTGEASSNVYQLWRPELAGYGIAAQVPHSGMPVNPLYELLR